MITTGRLISQTFTIERRFIRFLVGGGRHANTQIRLMVDGKAVRSTSGKDNEQLEAAMWDVSDLQGQTAHIEIVDEQQGGWGHINVDQIEFSDMPGNRAVMQLLEELLPARFSRVRPASDSGDEVRAVELEELTLKPGAAKSRASHGPKLVTWSVGKGKVVLGAGPVLDPARAGLSHHRQIAYGVLCWLVGAKYTGPVGFQHPKAPGFGTLALAALAKDTSVLPAAGHREDAWKAFAAEGRFTPLAEAQSSPPSPQGRTVYGAVSATVSVPAGKSIEVPFVLTWHYPNKYSAGARVDGMPLCHAMGRCTGGHA